MGAPPPPPQAVFRKGAYITFSRGSEPLLSLAGADPFI
jgi:hypothetical protein